MKNNKTTQSRQMTVEAYLAFEEEADVRHEYIEGQLIPMPGTTDTHNTICINIAIALRQLLNERNCKVYMENVKVQITDKKHYTYPDIFVTCDDRDKENSYIKQYPVLIIEVASPSTKVHDKTNKFLAYRKISSLRHYVIVDTEKQIVESYTTKNGEEWTSESYFSDEEAIVLDALDISLRLSDIYSQN